MMTMKTTTTTAPRSRQRGHRACSRTIRTSRSTTPCDLSKWRSVSGTLVSQYQAPKKKKKKSMTFQFLFSLFVLIPFSLLLFICCDRCFSVVIFCQTRERRRVNSHNVNVNHGRYSTCIRRCWYSCGARFCRRTRRSRRPFKRSAARRHAARQIVTASATHCCAFASVGTGAHANSYGFDA
jgi:hypothetical protein